MSIVDVQKLVEHLEQEAVAEMARHPKCYGYMVLQQEMVSQTLFTLLRQALSKEKLRVGVWKEDPLNAEESRKQIEEYGFATFEVTGWDPDFNPYVSPNVTDYLTRSRALVGTQWYGIDPDTRKMRGVHFVPCVFQTDDVLDKGAGAIGGQKLLFAGLNLFEFQEVNAFLGKGAARASEEASRKSLYGDLLEKGTQTPYLTSQELKELFAHFDEALVGNPDPNFHLRGAPFPLPRWAVPKMSERTRLFQLGLLSPR